MRTKPRNLKYKAKLRARVEADSIEARSIAETPEEIEVAEVRVKPKAKAKTAKSAKLSTKEKTPCQYCNKLFANTIKHEKSCKKNPNAEIKSSSNAESIAIKA